MFRRLHIQMTIFSAFITGLVLTAMSCICLYISESSMKENSYTSFLNNSSACITHLENQTVLTHQWLLEMQQSYNFQMELKDNGHPLYFQQINPPEQTEEVFRKAEEISVNTYGLDLTNPKSVSTLTKSACFPLSFQGDSYYIKTAMIPKKNGVLSAILLYSLDGLEAQIHQQRLYFFLAACPSLLLLWIFAWFFTDHMLRPIEESRRRQTQFIASASHELRSPLAVIVSSLSALKQADSRQALHFIYNMEQECGRMSKLVEDMLSLANADNHTWSIEKEPVELDTLLLSTYEKYVPLAKEKKLHLTVTLPEEPIVPFPCDYARISQVLFILLDNALSYVPEQGSIALSLHQEGSHPVILVADTGPGIAEEEKEAVFQRFYRADHSRHQREHFGLGLCIAKEIISLHKGSISITDTPGGGATFRIVL